MRIPRAMLAVALVTAPIAAACTRPAGAPRAQGQPGVERAEAAGGPEDFYLFRHAGAGSVPDAEGRAAIGAQAKRTATVGGSWKFLGPVNIGARVTDLVADVSHRDTLWAASASGGIWKSTDAGMTYSSVWPKSFPQAIGALTQGSNGTLWAGTGEANPGGGSVTYGGDGVYRSTDGGKSWANTGLHDASAFGRIAVDPTNPQHVFAAASGDLYNPGGQRGLYVTNDGGTTWTLALAPPNDTTGAVDVAIDPKAPNVVLVAMWDHIRYPDVRYYTGVGSGIWRSTDGGKTFARLGLTEGLPAPNEDIGRIGVTFDPQDPQKAYAVYANNQVGSFEGFFGSVDGGAHWVSMPGSATLGASQSVYGWWFGRVYVDPHDSNHIYIVGLYLAESTDGGVSFLPQLDQHADHHAIAWDPRVPGRVWDATDGGVYRSDQNGADGTWLHATVEPWNQFFTIDVSEQDASRINGGVQDNGSLRTWGGAYWNAYNGGDGVENRINPTDQQNVFACSQYGSCSRSDDGGDTMDEFDQNAQSDRYGWLAPIEIQPENGNVVYFAGDILNRSTDRGVTWTAISPDLGKGDGGREINPLYANHYGTVQAVGLDRAGPGTIYAGTDNGFLYRYDGATWTEIDSSALPKQWVTHIEVQPTDPNDVYVTFSGYHGGVHAPYVLRSTDGGSTWQDLSGNLPQAPVNDLVLVNGSTYVATDLGVFVAKAGTAAWSRVGSGLPLAPVNDLRYNAKSHSLFAGTFGRGVWSLALSA
ncbi:MAG: WD40/YVTN/BNR-like repeat-containing protein [Actinomycetota bacterium]